MSSISVNIAASKICDWKYAIVYDNYDSIVIDGALIGC